MSLPISQWRWVSPQTNKPVEEEWHIVLEQGLYDHFPTAYANPQEETDKPYLLRDEIAFGVTDADFLAGNEIGIISCVNNNSPPYRVWLGGRVRTRKVYVQVEFSYRSTLDGSNRDLLSNKQPIFNQTKRIIDSIMSSNPRLLFDYGLTYINTNPSVIQDGRAFTNFGMTGTLQPQFLQTLQDDYKWRYIQLYLIEITEMLV